MFFAGVNGISKPPGTSDPMILRVHLFFPHGKERKFVTSPGGLPNTWGLEVFGPPKTYHPNTEPQEAFGRLGSELIEVSNPNIFEA